MAPKRWETRACSLSIEPATLSAAANASDFVLIAIPQFAIAQLPGGLFVSTPPETIILDASNYYPGVRDSRRRPNLKLVMRSEKNVRPKSTRR
ncbi:MAG TPA: hypothetical protein VN150_01125 [Ochrobactrum sp.]|nr:hypothetical protein [Ochrobactrum sp.]